MGEVRRTTLPGNRAVTAGETGPGSPPPYHSKARKHNQRKQKDGARRNHVVAVGYTLLFFYKNLVCKNIKASNGS